MFGLHASFTITNATLQEAADMGRSLGTGFHIHAAESQSDQIFCEAHYKKRVIQRLLDFGVLGRKP